MSNCTRQLTESTAAESGTQKRETSFPRGPGRGGNWQCCGHGAATGSKFIPFQENPHPAAFATADWVCYDPPRTGYGAAWLARLTGGQEVVGSNPASPISNRTENRTCGSCLQVRFFFGDGGFAQHREVHGCIRHHAVHASSGCDGNGGLRQNWRLQFRSDVSHGGKTRHRRLDGRSPAPLLPPGPR